MLRNADRSRPAGKHSSGDRTNFAMRQYALQIFPASDCLMTLSVAIVAMDEEANIGRTLASVLWADEIVLVDSGSKDRTCEIAREHGARGVVEPWRGYVAQKQYAIELCTQDWVLLLDADEEVSPGLAEEIQAAIASPNATPGYKLPRQILFLGRWI